MDGAMDQGGSAGGDAMDVTAPAPDFGGVDSAPIPEDDVDPSAGMG
jgi:hypothetical protein